MAVVTSEYGLVEQAKRLDPDGKLATIAEVLNVATGEILTEAPWLPSNDVWVNKTVRRFDIPTASRRRLNKGVARGSSKTTEVMDVIEMLGVFAEYDKDYITSFPDAGRQRLIESKAFIEGMGQALVSDILYCDSNVETDGMHGFMPRLNAIDSEFVIDAGGSGGTASILVVGWGEDTVFLTYPKNMQNLGIEHQAFDEMILPEYDSAGAYTGREYVGYKDYYQVKCGLVVKDQRCIGRVANIEASGTSNIFDENLLIDLLSEVKITPMTRIYMNQTLMAQGRKRLNDKNNVHWSPEQGLAGLPFMSFDGIPVRKIDKRILLNTEEEVS